MAAAWIFYDIGILCAFRFNEDIFSAHVVKYVAVFKDFCRNPQRSDQWGYQMYSYVLRLQGWKRAIKYIFVGGTNRNIYIDCPKCLFLRSI